MTNLEVTRNLINTILHKMVNIEHNIQEMRSENQSQLSANQSINSARNNKELDSDSYIINSFSKHPNTELSSRLKKQNNSNSLNILPHSYFLKY